MYSLVLVVRERKGDLGRLKLNKKHFQTQRVPHFNKLGPTEVMVKVNVSMPTGPGEEGEIGRLSIQAKQFNLLTER